MEVDESRRKQMELEGSGASRWDQIRSDGSILMQIETQGSRCKQSKEWSRGKQRQAEGSGGKSSDEIIKT